MATLLTPVETPFGGQSCASAEVGRRVEVLPGEAVTGRASGMSDAGMKGRQKEAIGSGESGQEADWMPKKAGRSGMTICYNAQTAAGESRAHNFILGISYPVFILSFTLSFTPRPRVTKCRCRTAVKRKLAPPHGQRLDHLLSRRSSRAKSREVARAVRASPPRDQRSTVSASNARRRHARKKRTRRSSPPTCRSRVEDNPAADQKYGARIERIPERVKHPRFFVTVPKKPRPAMGSSPPSWKRFS